jgi:hypothetical protein
MVRALDCGNGGDSKIPIMSDNVWKSLGLDSTPLGHVFEAINDEIQKASVFINLT